MVDAQTTTVAAWAEQLITIHGDQWSAEDLATLAEQVEALRCAAVCTPSTPLPPTPLTPTVVRTTAELAELAKALCGEPVVAVDLETTSLDPRCGQVVGIGVAVAARTFYVPLHHRDQQTGQLLPDQLLLAEVAAAVNFAELPLVAHNAKFELKWLRQHLGLTPHFTWDVMIAAALLRSDLPAGLKEVAVRELDVPDWGLSQADLQAIGFLPIARVARYCAADCRHILELYRRQVTCLS